MTQKEFEDRTGLNTNAEEYAAIEKMYMAAGDMDKDEFCLCWRQTGKNPLTKILARQVEILKGQLEERNNELDDAQYKKRIKLVSCSARLRLTRILISDVRR